MEQMHCNKCGKVIEVRNEIPQEDFLRVCKSWGYFSKKDGVTQEFILCESCVEQMVKDFVFPVSVRETVEML